MNGNNKNLNIFCRFYLVRVSGYWKIDFVLFKYSIVRRYISEGLLVCFILCFIYVFIAF